MPIILNGSSQGVDLGSNNALWTTTDPVTVIATIKPYAVQSNAATIFRVGEQNSPPYVGYGLSIAAAQNSVKADINLASTYGSTTSANLWTAGTPIVAVMRWTYTSESLVDIFLGGTKGTTLTSGGGTVGAVPELGMLGYSKTFGEYFLGEISCVLLSTAAWSDGDITGLTPGEDPRTVHSTGVLGYWPLTSDASDSGPNGINGTLIGSPAFGTGSGVVNVNTTDTFAFTDITSDLAITDSVAEMSFTDTSAITGAQFPADTFTFTDTSSVGTSPASTDSFGFTDTAQITVLGENPTSNDTFTFTDVASISASTEFASAETFTFVDTAFVVEAGVPYDGVSTVTIVGPHSTTVLTEATA